MRRGIAAHGAVNWLRLAAAPTFAIMALLTALPGGGPQDILCAAAQHASPLSGMAMPTGRGICCVMMLGGSTKEEVGVTSFSCSAAETVNALKVEPGS